MGENSKRDWAWTPILTMAGMHVMMTGIVVTTMLYLNSDLSNRMLSVEEKLRELIEDVSGLETRFDERKQEWSK